jgi:hypothetical protein
MGKLTDEMLSWTFDINGKPAMSQLTQLEQKTKSLEKVNAELGKELQIIEAKMKKSPKNAEKLKEQYELLTSKIRDNNKTLRQAKKRMSELRGEVGINGLTINQLNKRYKDLQNKIKNSTPKTTHWRKYRRELKAVEKRLNQLGHGKKRVSKIFSGFKSLLPTLGIGAILMGIKKIGQKAIQVRKIFSKYNAVLKNALGSQNAATKSFKNLQKFAGKTPFQLEELTGAYVKLVNQGFKPTMEEMRKMGDLTAAQGKGFDQLAEAIIDAQQGEFERLKEFGIRAQKHGDKVSFTFKGVKKEVDFTNQSIQDYILSLGDMKGVKGGMDEISKTIGGAISNTGDSIDKFFNKIGASIEPMVVNILGGISSLLDSFSDDDVIKKLEDEGKEVEKLVTLLQDANNTEEQRKEILKKLNAINPLITKGLNAQNIATEKLKDNLSLYNKELRDRIALEKQNTKIDEKQEELNKKQERLYDAQGGAAQLIIKYDKDLALDAEKTLEEKMQETIKHIESNYKLKTWTSNRKGVTHETTTQAGSDAGNLVYYINHIKKYKKEIADLNKELADLDKEKMEIKKALDLVNGNSKGGNKPFDFNAEIKALKKQNKAKIDLINNQYLNEQLSKEEHADALLAQEILYLKRKKDLTLKAGNNISEIEEKFVQKSIQLMEKKKNAAQHIQKLIDDFNNGLSKDEGDFLNNISNDDINIDDEGYTPEDPFSISSDNSTEENINNFENTAFGTESEELAALDALHEAKLIKEEEYEQRRQDIASKWAANRQVIQDTAFNVSGQMLDALSTMYEAQMNRELASAGDNEAKKEAIRKKYAKKQQRVAIGQALIAGAMAVMRIWQGQISGNPIIDAAIKAALTVGQVAMTAAQVAKIKSQQFKKGGKVSVVGADDNKLYNADYKSTDRGYFSKPTLLVSEEGGEFVASNTTVKNPTIRPFLDIIDEKQRNGTVHTLNLFDVMDNINKSTNYKKGGYTW